MHYGDASGMRPKKLQKDGALPCFTTDYSEFGRREQPSTVLPGAPELRLQNRYGERDRLPPMPKMFGPFG